eukprot:gene8428-biopygen22623
MHPPNRLSMKWVRRSGVVASSASTWKWNTHADHMPWVVGPLEPDQAGGDSNKQLGSCIKLRRRSVGLLYCNIDHPLTSSLNWAPPERTSAHHSFKWWDGRRAAPMAHRVTGNREPCGGVKSPPSQVAVESRRPQVPPPQSVRRSSQTTPAARNLRTALSARVRPGTAPAMARHWQRHNRPRATSQRHHTARHGHTRYRHGHGRARPGGPSKGEYHGYIRPALSSQRLRVLLPGAQKVSVSDPAHRFPGSGARVSRWCSTKAHRVRWRTTPYPSPVK